MSRKVLSYSLSAMTELNNNVICIFFKQVDREIKNTKHRMISRNGRTHESGNNFFVIFFTVKVS